MNCHSWVHTPAGLIVIDAAPFSHTMIQLLGLNIPIVIISKLQAKQVPAQSYLRINGNNGEVKAVDPHAVFQCEPPLTLLPGQPVSTADGVAVYLNASVSSADAASRALNHGAAAIGLVRSEFLRPSDESIPDGEYCQRVFTEICEAAKPLSITIRLLDLAPDKKPPWLKPLAGMHGPLGLQGVRTYHIEAVQQVVLAQLAAINQLTAKFHIRLLIPYVTSSKEFRHWRDTIKSLLASPIEVGAMLETPAAVLDIDNWLAQADFVSIGCNDLMQCLFAADRDLPPLQHYLNPYAPALLRFLQQTAISAGDQIHKIQLCGLLPQWPGILPLMVVMGYTNYSVEPLKIPYLAQTIAAINVKKMQSLIEQVCHAPNAPTVCGLLNAPDWPEK
jgi:phosphoenolpyruvate-protein kinase (PTS system EI component)